MKDRTNVRGYLLKEVGVDVVEVGTQVSGEAQT
jgi:hypothetical protein